MQLIDTNVILRYLLNDHEKLYSKACLVFSALEQGEQKAIITEGVLIECVYVLLKVYKVPRPLVAEKLMELFGYPGLNNTHHALFTPALDIFARHNVDIVDALLFVRSQREGWTIISFDKDIEKIARRVS